MGSEYYGRRERFVNYKEELLRELARARSAIRKIVGAMFGELAALATLAVGHLITGNMKVPLMIICIIMIATIIVWLYFRWTVGKLRKEVRNLIDGDRYS